MSWERNKTKERDTERRVTARSAPHGATNKTTTKQPRSTIPREQVGRSSKKQRKYSLVELDWGEEGRGNTNLNKKRGEEEPLIGGGGIDMSVTTLNVVLEQLPVVSTITCTELLPP